MMALERHGPDTYVGVGPDYPWGGLFGGQIVAQGLRAAGSSVPEGFRPHSLHAYFVRRGDSAEPIRFEVDRVRNGRSFTTRTVVARQSTGAILTMTASFHVEEDAPAVQASAPPEVPAASSLPTDGWTAIFDRRTVQRPDEVGVALAWTRIVEDVGDDPLLHACGLAFVSDDLPTDAAIALDPRRDPGRDPNSTDHPFMSASLDHAMWFHRPCALDDWLLYTQDSPSSSGARGMTRGALYTRSGTLVASVAQEGLIRKRADE